jgi:hypothetical protein
MRRTAIFVLCFVSAACQQESTSNTKSVHVRTTTIAGDAKNANVDQTVKFIMPPTVEKSAIGLTLDASGNVAMEDSAFHEGEPVHITLWLRESPPGLKTSATWFSPANKVIRREERPMAGQKTVTFTYDKPKLAPGSYRVETFWGGNLAVSKDFEVLAGKRK